MTINIAEAKANLSKIIDMAYRGEKITIAKNNTPLVDLVIHKLENKRELGLCKKAIKINENFNDEIPQINEMFYK